MLKAIKIAGVLVSLVVAAMALVVFLGTTVFSEQLFGLYAGRLDKWVADGAPVSSLQSDVVDACGKLVMSQAGFFGFLSMYTINRAALDFRVDACVKMTANRAYKQPEFENPKIVRLFCEGEDQLFRRLCTLSGIKAAPN